MDYNDYFISRINQDNSLGGTDKFEQLQQASRDKIAELGKIKEAQLAQEKAAAGSLAGQWGLDADSLAGRATNTVANIYHGAFRGIGNVASAIPTAIAAADQANLSEDDIAALGRHEKGQSTPEDLVRINRKVAPIVAPTPGMPRELAQAHANERAQAMADSNPDAPTPLSMWKEMNVARKSSTDITKFFDTSNMLNPNAQNSFGADLTSTYDANAPQIAKGWQEGSATDVAAGVAKLLLGGVADVASNPQATLEYIAQNAPQLFIGLAGKVGATAQVVDNVASAANHYNKGIQDYQAKNGGALPPEDQRQSMALYAATHAGAEILGDKIGLAATKLGGEVAKDVSRASFKSALKGTATAVGEGVLSEAPTEVYQQFAEGQITGKPATGAEMFAAGVIGGASGAGLSGGGRAVSEAAKLAATPSKAKQETIDYAKVQAAAIASGDVSALKDPVEQIAALFGHSQKADTTPEQKQTNLTKASEIIANLEAKQEEAQLETQNSTVSGVKALIAERQALLQDPEYANDPIKVGKINQLIEFAQEDLARLEASKDVDKIGIAAQKQLDTVNTQLREARTVKDNLAVLVQAKNSIDSDIALISAPPQEANDALAAGVAPRATAAVGVSQEQTAAAERIVTLAMTAPERLDTKVVAALAADTNNALTTPQRAYLSAFLRAQQTNPTLKAEHVAADIFNSKYGNKGVVDFRKNVDKAFAVGNAKAAYDEILKLYQFAQAHKDKAVAAGQAIKLGLGTPILKENGKWVPGAPGAKLTDEQRKAGGRYIDSGRLALLIEDEANALGNAVAELQAAYDLKFNTSTKVDTNVKNTSQQGSGSSAEVKGTTEQVKKPAGDAAAVASAGTTDGKPTGVVGASTGQAAGVVTKSNTGEIEKATAFLGQARTLEELQKAMQMAVRERDSGGSGTGTTPFGKQGPMYNPEHQLSKDWHERDTVVQMLKAAIAAQKTTSLTPKETVAPVDTAQAAIENMTSEEWSQLIGPLQGAARENAVHEPITPEDAALVKKMVTKTIVDGVRNGKTREQIMGQIERLTKGGINHRGISNIHQLLDTSLPAAAHKIIPAKKATTSNSHQSAIDTMIAEEQNTIAKAQENLDKGSSKNFTNPDKYEANLHGQIAAAKTEIARLDGLRDQKTDPQQAAQLVDKIINAKQGSVEKREAAQALRSFPETYVAVRALTDQYLNASVANVKALRGIRDQILADHSLKLINEEKQALIAKGVSEKDAETIAKLKNENRQLAESMESRPEFGPDADAAIGAKKARMAANAKRINELTEKTTNTEETSVSSVNTESTQSTETTKNTEEEVKSTTEVATQPDGKLEVMATKSPEGTSFNLRNLLADFFTQTAGSDSDTTLRPLVTVKDFLSQMSSKKVLESLSITELTDKQFNVLRTFKSAALSWAATIQSNLSMKKNAEFRYEDMTQFFLKDTENGPVLEENVQTAMSYAAFSWIAENASRSRFNTPEEINLILGRDEDHAVSKAEMAVLGAVGTRQNVVANALGQRAVQALGLKAVKNAPKDLMPRLESALGAHIFKMLMDQGILERVTVSGSVMKQLTGNEKTNEKAEFQFLRIATDSDGKLNAGAAKIQTATKGTQGILDKVFSVEAGLKEPSLAPIPFTQTKTKNTQQGVPSKLAAVMEHENSVASYVRQDMWQLVNQIAEETMMEIAGAEHLEGKHAANIPSLEATNDGLARELGRFKDFVGGMVDSTVEMFFEHTVWKQQRVGIATNAINPQTSKIHRHMLFRKSWETKIDRNDAAQMENFQLRVAEGLGVKTDKQGNVKSLEKYNEKVADPRIQAAVAVLVQMLEGQDMSADKEKTLVIGVNAGGEKMHSLDALMALAQEQFTTGDTFTTHLMGEVDGVTNGPMLSHLLMGAANSVADLFKLLNRGGFYEQGNEHSQYNLWREAAGHFDLYETTALHMTQAVQEFINTGIDLGKGRAISGAQVNTIVQAIYAFTGPLELKGVVQKEGRNIIKTPLTAMVFGSSVGSAVESMADKFVESIYAGMEDLAAGKGDRVEMIEHINTLLSSRIIPVNASVEQLMKTEFTPEQVDRLKRSFKNTVGKAVAQTMEQDFESFISQRQQFNHAAQMTFELYNSAYTALRDQMIKDLIESGEIAVTSKGDPIHDLTAQQENLLRKQLADLAPVMHTMMSKESGQLNAGLYISKSGKALSTKKTHEGSIKFGTKFSDNGAASTGTRGFETVETAPGVSMAPMSVHSTDSAIMHTSIGDTQVLNVHDAKGVGVAGFQEAAQSLNQSTWNAMLNYSPASEMFAALSRTVIGLAALVEKGDLPPAVMANVANALQAFADKHEMDPATVLRQMVQGTFTMANRADNIKLQALEQMQAIDQYALQGGNYKVTKEDREEAAARRAELPTALSNKEVEAIAQLEALLKVQATEKPVKQKKDIEEDAPTLVSPFGVVGKPSTKGDPALVKFFEENPTATAKQVIKFLYDKLTADTGAVNRDFNLKLLKLLLRSVNPKLTFSLVTKDTKESDVLSVPNSPALGWYPTGQTDEVIYIVGNDFTHSNIQVEVLLHELTHAATAYRLFATAGKAFQAELNTLLEQVRKYAKDAGITKFDAALSNVDELVAYGMTSRPFQQLLAQVPVRQSTNKVSDALQELVGVLARLLGFKETKDAKALGVLITNVTALMEQGANERTEQENRSLSMAAPLNTYSTIDIHEALADGSLTNEFDQHLRSLLGNLVYKLHGAFGSFKASLMENQSLDATDVWLKALNTGLAPFASEALGHIATTPQVAYAMEQVEATVRAALETNESQTKMVYKELYKLYGEAEKMVTVQALIDAGLDAVTAKATHDILFKLEKNSGERSNYLARFAAMGLAHPVINQVLQAATAKESRKARDGKTFMERLEIIFENTLRIFQTYVTRTYQGQPANDKLLSLVGQLVDIEAKYQRKIEDKASRSNYLEPLEDKLKVFVEAAGNKIEAIAGSNYVRNHKNTYVKLAGGLVGTIAGGRADLFMEGLFKLRAQTFKKRFGVVASLMQAYVGQDVVFQGLLRMTKLLEHDRQKQVAGWATSALEAFADAGKGLRGKTKESMGARASITSVFMRTGAHNLMGDFDMAAIEQLVTNKAALDTAITSFESKLAVHGRAAPYYVNQANALGYQKATGIVRTKFLNHNAHAIARMAGTTYQSSVSETQAEQAEATLKVLVTLYALRYSNSVDMGFAGSVIKEENSRTDGNGVEFTLLLQKRLEAESLERLFGNNPMLMAHGYTSEIYDPNVTIKTANALEGKALIELGYVKRAEVPLDPADVDRDVKHLYVLQDGGVPRFVSGVVSNRGMRAKGTTIHNGYTNAYNQTGIANASQNAALMQDRQAAIADMFRPGPVKDLSKEKGSYLAPVFNETGTVTNWRYMMAETTKNNVLNRNNRFDKVLGTIAGSIYDKETSREQNMTAVTALHDQFKADYQKNAGQYQLVGVKSTDPEMREIWNLLPEDTRKDIQKVWGYNGMMVRVDNLDIMFGYRKLSVGTLFQKANEERDARKLAGQRTEVMALKTLDAWQKLIVMMFEFPLVGSGLKQGLTMEEAKKYARKAGANAVRTEHIWQAIVSETKDIIVVKSGLVLLGNMSSNMWLLGMSGVPLLDVMHHHLVAWKGAVSWKKDTDELEHLKRLRDTGYTQGNKADIDRRILRLEDSLDRNPVKELVEAGLMPTIVEDIDPEDDIYSYKSHLVRKVEGYTDKLNPTLVRAARTAYLAHDTKIYQAMSQMTRLSDFMARYTMYQHLISKKDPLSAQEATQKVSESFINYDIALHRNIQYTDDMGITMFTKYFIGIQKVLVDTLRENPARVLTGVLLSKFLGLGPTVLDGSMWNHIGNNPFRTGPFELLDALDELPMINAPLAMFNMGGSPVP